MRDTRPLNGSRWKGSLVGVLVLLVAASFLLILPGCRGPLAPPPAANDGATGTLSLTLGMSGADGRTIMPGAGDLRWEDFVQFGLDFRPGAATPSADLNRTVYKTDLTNGYTTTAPIRMPVGNWTIVVTGYIDRAGTPTPVAEGRVFFRMDPEEDRTGAASPRVYLGPIIGSGLGRFAWEISGLADSIYTAFMYVQRDNVNFGSRIDLSDISNRNGYRELPTGEYRVVFRLTNTTGEEVEISEILRVYRNMTSTFDCEGFFYPDFMFPIALLDHILRTWRDLQPHNLHWAGIGARHFDILGIMGVTDGNFYDLTHHRFLALHHQHVPDSLQDLTEAVDAALIVRAYEDLIASNFVTMEAAEIFLDAITAVNTGDIINWDWENSHEPRRAIASVGPHYTVDIGFDRYLVREVFIYGLPVELDWGGIGHRFSVLTYPLQAYWATVGDTWLDWDFDPPYGEVQFNYMYGQHVLQAVQEEQHRGPMRMYFSVGVGTLPRVSGEAVANFPIGHMRNLVTVLGFEDGDIPGLLDYRVWLGSGLPPQELLGISQSSAEWVLHDGTPSLRINRVNYPPPYAHYSGLYLDQSGHRTYGYGIIEALDHVSFRVRAYVADGTIEGRGFHFNTIASRYDLGESYDNNFVVLIEGSGDVSRSVSGMITEDFLDTAIGPEVWHYGFRLNIIYDPDLTIPHFYVDNITIDRRQGLFLVVEPWNFDTGMPGEDDIISQSSVSMFDTGSAIVLNGADRFESIRWYHGNQPIDNTFIERTEQSNQESLYLSDIHGNMLGMHSVTVVVEVKVGGAQVTHSKRITFQVVP